MTLGKTRFWLMVTALFGVLTAKPGLLQPAISPVLEACVETDACAWLNLILTGYLTHILFGLMLLVVTLTAARRLPALGTSAVWSVLILMLCAMSLATITSVGEGTFALGQMPAIGAALAGFMAFLAVCPDPGYRGYRIRGVGSVWLIIWAATALTIWGSLPALADALAFVSGPLAAALQAPLAAAQGPVALAQEALPIPLDDAMLAILGTGFIAQLLLRIGRRPMIA